MKDLGTQATDIRLCPVDRGPCDNLTVPSLRTQPSSHSLMAEHSFNLYTRMPHKLLAGVQGDLKSLNEKARVRSPMGRSAPNLHATDPTGESGGVEVSPISTAEHSLLNRIKVHREGDGCEVQVLTGELIQSLTVFA